MAAPTFSNAGTGVVESGGPASTVTSGTGSIGDLLILHILEDGGPADFSLASYTNVEDLAGTDGALTTVVNGGGLGVVGGGGEASQHIFIGRALSTSGASVSLTSGGISAYARWYRFNGASTGTTLATVIENGAGTQAEAAATSNTIADVGVTTNGADRLACNLIGVNDDNALGSFTGESGGDWTLAADYGSATGTDGEIGLQTATIASAGTINGGTYTMVASDAWGVVGFAILPAAVEDTAPAENAAATGTSYAATGAVTSSAGHASATGTAYDADGGVGPLAGNPAATGAAYNPTAIITAGIGHAAAAAAAYDADGGVGPLAESTAATGAAYDATNAVGQSAANAAATGAANQPSATITVPAGHASATGAANDATVSTATATNAPAENAAATGAANSPTAAVGPGAGHSAATGAANAPTATLAAGIGTVAATSAALQASAALASNAANAAAIAAAYDPSIAGAVTALLAAATGQAFDATVQTSGSTNAPAEHASATGAAYDATVSAVVPSATPSAGSSWFRMPPPQPVPLPHAEAHAGVAVAAVWAFRPSTEWDDDEAAIALLLET